MAFFGFGEEGEEEARASAQRGLGQSALTTTDVLVTK